MLAGLARDGEVRNFEYRFRTRSGETRMGLFSADVIEFHGERCLLAITHDITERVQTEQALRDSEERYRTIIETIEDGYYELDTAGRVTDTNSAFERMVGYPPSRLRGMAYRDLMDAANAQRVAVTLNDVYASGVAQRIEDWELRRAGGGMRTIAASGAPARGATGWTKWEL